MQLVLYSAARWLQDTFNPGGIPTVGTPIVGAPDPTTGAVTFRPVFTDHRRGAADLQGERGPDPGHRQRQRRRAVHVHPHHRRAVVGPARRGHRPARNHRLQRGAEHNQIINATVNPAILSVLPLSIPVGTGNPGQSPPGGLGPGGNVLYVSTLDGSANGCS